MNDHDEEIQEFDGVKYKKVHDGSMLCKGACCFHSIDEYGNVFCKAPQTSDFRFDGCAVGNFHWEQV